MSPIRMAKVESASRTVLALNKAFNRHDLDAMSLLISGDCVLESHGPAPDGSTFSGKDAISRWWQDLFKRSPGACVEIEELLGMGHRCILMWKAKGLEEEGKKTHLRGVDIYEEKDGRIFHIYSYVKG